LISSQLAHLARGSTIILITPSSEEKIMTVVMELIQRGLIPVVILIDQTSFGRKLSTFDLESALISHGILTFIIKEGDDIKQVLESPQFAFNRKFLYS
jgi:hypothetical protein